MIKIFERGRPPRRLSYKAALAGVLLLANFPLAYAYTTIASFSHVTVINNTAATFDSVVITDPRGNRWQLGPLPPGASTREWYKAEGVGSIQLHATSSTGQTQATIDPYISGNELGQQNTATINGPANVSVR